MLNISARKEKHHTNMLLILYRYRGVWKILSYYLVIHICNNAIHQIFLALLCTQGWLHFTNPFTLSMAVWLALVNEPWEEALYVTSWRKCEQLVHKLSEHLFLCCDNQLRWGDSISLVPRVKRHGPVFPSFTPIF